MDYLYMVLHYDPGRNCIKPLAHNLSEETASRDAAERRQRQEPAFFLRQTTTHLSAVENCGRCYEEIHEALTLKQMASAGGR